MKKALLLAAALASLSACAAPTEDGSEAKVDVETDGAEPSMLNLKLPDYAASTYSGDNACVIYGENGLPQKWRYRFVLSNKGNASGTIPMIKVRIANDSAGLAYLKYMLDVYVAAGTSQVVTIDVPQMYPTTYTAEVNVDPAKTITEWNETNNVLVQQIGFTSGLPGDGKCKD